MKLNAGQFYGDVSKPFSIENFSFTESSYSSDSKLPYHTHELAHFCFVLNGNYTEKIGRWTFERKPASIVYYPTDVRHKENHLTDGMHFMIEINNEGLERIKEHGIDITEPVLLETPNTNWLMTRMYQEFMRRDTFSSLTMESISNELLVESSRQHFKTNKDAPPKWLKTVKEYLNDNYSLPTKLSEVAKCVGVHPTHLSKVFRKYEKCTAGEYIRKVRIEKARQSIMFSDKPIVDIALETGFTDQPHFTRTFKKETGISPNKFRKSFQKN